MLLLAGCLPATWTIMPAVRGRVVTATGAPAAGATVRIVEAGAPSEIASAVEVNAGADGRFVRAEETRWTIVPLLPLDAIAPRFIATASRAGVESDPKEFGGGITNPHHLGITNRSGPFDLGDLVITERAGER
jgi:hypothetical protein